MCVYANANRHSHLACGSMLRTVGEKHKMKRFDKHQAGCSTQEHPWHNEYKAVPHDKLM